MGNLSIPLAVTAGDGTGASSDTSRLGKERTIIVDGAFTGMVQIEAANGAGFVAVASFTNADQQTIDLAAGEMRVVRSISGGSTPGVTIASNDDGMQFLDLPIVGTSIDTSALGTFNTVIVDGDVDGVLNIEMSEDETNWVPVMSFQAPGNKSKDFIAPFMRVRHVNNVLSSTPTVSVGATNDDTAHKPQATLVAAANVVVDGASATNGLELELTQNVILDNPINVEPGQVLELAVRQDGTGNRTAAYGNAWQWPGGTNPVITVTAGAEDKIRCYVRAVDASGVATVMLCTFEQAFAV